MVNLLAALAAYSFLPHKPSMLDEGWKGACFDPRLVVPSNSR